MDGRRQYVFGYGSLLERRDGNADAAAPTGGLVVCDLIGHRRTWNVAMDNTQTIPGYKYYVDAATGAREPWFVAFLNIVPDADASVNGVLFEVDDAQLRRLDRRERNYDRIDVSTDIAPAVDGTVWAYSGTAAAMERFRVGRRTGRAVISREYCERVRDDFARVGPEALRQFTDRTDSPPCPIVDLQRIDVAPGAAGTRTRVASRSGAASA